MKYKAPEVEDGQETDDVTIKSKRKRAGDETPVTQERSEDKADLEPPSKATRAEESPGVDEDDDRGFLGEEGEFDEGDLDEDLSEEGDDEGYDEVLGVAEKEDMGQKKSRGSPIEEKLQKTIEKYGRGPLEGTAIAEQALTGSADAILAMLIDAMLKSRPISHELTDRTLRTIIDAGYHDVHKLGDASWEERAMVLKDGGYNRYREQGSTNLGKLVELVNEKYEGDLNNLLKNAEYDPQKTRQLVKEIHGLGDLGVELFFNNVQSVWPSIAPFVDSRSLQTAEDVGIGSDLNAIYANLNKDSVSMCKLANALSNARLERRVGDLVAIGFHVSGGRGH